MSKKRRAAKIMKRRPRSWLGVLSALFALGALAFTVYEPDAEGKVTDSAQIFEAFADLNVGADQVLRMRNSPNPPRQKPSRVRWRMVTAVLDGDTLKLDGGDTVRLIGVDTPESSENRKLREDIHKMGLPVRERDLVRLGKAATDFTRGLAEGRKVWLEHENSATDQYGRLLAYVHLEDGRILNEEILAHGYGKAYLSYSFRYKKRYILIQADASRRNAGLWSGR